MASGFSTCSILGSPEASFDPKVEVGHDARNQRLQASDHPASCHEADEGSDHVVN